MGLKKRLFLSFHQTFLFSISSFVSFQDFPSRLHASKAFQKSSAWGVVRRKKISSILSSAFFISVGLSPLCQLYAKANMRIVSLGDMHAGPETFKPCAIDPTYQYFENIQYAAYQASPEFQAELPALRDMQEVLRGMKQTGIELKNRQNPLGGRGWDPKNTDEYITKSLKQLKLPTCYENPLTFFLLTAYSKRIDQARKELQLPLPSLLKLATLPTTDINAYTYPAKGNIGSVVALNTELFLFIW
jgi:hypothetical protein